MSFKKFIKTDLGYLLGAIVICELVGMVGAFFTMPAIDGWYAGLNRPSFSPPDWIFAPVWTLLFFLMGISLYLVWKKGWKVKVSQKEKKEKVWNSYTKKLWTGAWREENVIVIFILQLVLNIWWSVIFFGLEYPGLAFFEILMLWFAILYTILNFYRISKPAAYLLLPYILWVSFAIVLNYSFWMLN
jgi:tryptophan-rich sensory protein